MVSVIDLRLPSPISQRPLTSDGACGPPRASEPWQPLQVPPASSPWKILSPSATCSLVAPGGIDKEAVLSRPASGWMPSGGPGSPTFAAATLGAGAGAIGASAAP